MAFANKKVTGHFGILPSSGGLNFYIGNNPEYRETLTVRPGWKWDQLTNHPAKYGAKKDEEFQAFFYRETLRYIRTQPLGFLGGIMRKFLQFIGSREIPRNVEIYLFRKWSILLEFLVWKKAGFGFPFGLLFPLAVVGIWYNRRRMPAPLLLYLVIYPLSVILVFVSARYRVPVVPAMAVCASAGFFALRRLIVEGKWRRVFYTFFAVLPLVLLSFLPGPFCEEEVNYEAEYYLYLATTDIPRETSMNYLEKVL